MNRISETFKNLKANNKKAFVSYVMAYDPNEETCLKLLNCFVENGVDILEIGLPFSDPMAEGEIIQKAAERVLEKNIKQKYVLNLVKKFREKNQQTPIILMGYYNPIFYYGIENFIRDAKNVGADGFIIVDLPPEEDEEFTNFATKQNLALIKLTTPTTTDERAEKILKTASGFVYYVSVAGVTGQKETDFGTTKEKIELLKKQTSLPICVGFGIKTPEQAKQASEIGDGIIIGSAFVKIIEENINDENLILSKISDLTKNVRKAIDGQ
jgi:tryptophan synthase alpha chain